MTSLLPSCLSSTARWWDSQLVTSGWYCWYPDWLTVQTLQGSWTHSSHWTVIGWPGVLSLVLDWIGTVAIAIVVAAAATVVPTFAASRGAISRIEFRLAT